NSDCARPVKPSGAGWWVSDEGRHLRPHPARHAVGTPPGSARPATVIDSQPTPRRDDPPRPGEDGPAPRRPGMAARNRRTHHDRAVPRPPGSPRADQPPAAPMKLEWALVRLLIWLISLDTCLVCETVPEPIF